MTLSISNYPSPLLALRRSQISTNIVLSLGFISKLLCIAGTSEMWCGVVWCGGSGVVDGVGAWLWLVLKKWSQERLTLTHASSQSGYQQQHPVKTVWLGPVGPIIQLDRRFSYRIENDFKSWSWVWAVRAKNKTWPPKRQNFPLKHLKRQISTKFLILPRIPEKILIYRSK